MGARGPTAHAHGEATVAGCCPFYHEAVELVGRRWTGAILRVLMDGPLRFSEICREAPDVLDPLLSQPRQELDARGDAPLPDGPRARAGALREYAIGLMITCLESRPRRNLNPPVPPRLSEP